MMTRFIGILTGFGIGNYMFFLFYWLSEADVPLKKLLGIPKFSVLKLLSGYLFVSFS